jgi:hypothetical protein
LQFTSTPPDQDARDLVVARFDGGHQCPLAEPRIHAGFDQCAHGPAPGAA